MKWKVKKMQIGEGNECKKGHFMDLSLFYLYENSSFISSSSDLFVCFHWFCISCILILHASLEIIVVDGIPFLTPQT